MGLGDRLSDLDGRFFFLSRLVFLESGFELFSFPYLDLSLSFSLAPFSLDDLALSFVASEETFSLSLFFLVLSLASLSFSLVFCLSLVFDFLSFTIELSLLTLFAGL